MEKEGKEEDTEFPLLSREKNDVRPERKIIKRGRGHI